MINCLTLFILTSRILSAIQPPSLSYQLHLPVEVQVNGFLSPIQLETIRFICQRHQQMTPEGR